LLLEEGRTTGAKTGSDGALWDEGGVDIAERKVWTSSAWGHGLRLEGGGRGPVGEGGHLCLEGGWNGSRGGMTLVEAGEGIWTGRLWIRHGERKKRVVTTTSSSCLLLSAGAKTVFSSTFQPQTRNSPPFAIRLRFTRISTLSFSCTMAPSWQTTLHPVCMFIFSFIIHQ